MSLPDQHSREHELRGALREAWGQALVAVGDAGDEVQRLLGRVTGFVDVAPDEARRLKDELVSRLRDDRDQLEAAVETAVRRAVASFRLPDAAQFAALDARLAALEARVEQVAGRRAH